MTRKQLIKNINERMRYWKRKGVEINIPAQQYTTQQLVALSKKRGKAFVGALQSSRTTRATALGNMINKLRAEGYIIDEPTLAEAMRTDKQKLERIIKMSRDELINMFAPLYKIGVVTPWGKESTSIIPSTLQTAIEKAEFASAMAAAEAGYKMVYGERYYSAEGAEKYLKSLLYRSRPEYYEDRDRLYIRNTLDKLIDMSKYNTTAKQILIEMRKLPPDEIEYRVLKAYRQNKDFDFLTIYYNGDIALSFEAISSILELDISNMGGD